MTTPTLDHWDNQAQTVVFFGPTEEKIAKALRAADAAGYRRGLEAAEKAAGNAILNPEITTGGVLPAIRKLKEQGP